MKKMLKEFKEFAVKGNVLDLAVGVVVGGAFSKIVTSLVNDIIMPIVGILTGGINFSEYKIVLKDAVGKNPSVTLNIGNFIQTSVNFLIISFCIFLFIKALIKLKSTNDKEVSTTKEENLNKVSEEVLLLRDIKELLQK
ncbi:MAG: large-conductance mechanosensitive channel protein MscL [Paraclostridium sordellii]|uniref:large-conductance mechanosensitive channel protein MscL n=1 Tax=Paraclostridium sordellii TaxID=1505 RepID=UPI000541A005|nr:large-conductance mechanosensitive channel protein MscL [Paeniclostridium sordellii]CEK33623.1 large conductance mechanosensitive channel protein,Large-conductance mechanosensitive channel,large-conductance mechanosensitive channel,large conductance mechanosensitive channel protein,Large-conductance mechanosensitive channel, MscL [[Clostridium] sordellii] [Paeniclostridium sordellii]CEQ10123.1 large conductance mechanosensitive channel protein [[Clostridium] sordellii] [Paeniclostridium sordel